MLSEVAQAGGEMFGDLDGLLDSFVVRLHTGMGNLAEPRKLGRKWDGCLVVTTVIVDGGRTRIEVLG